MYAALYLQRALSSARSARCLQTEAEAQLVLSQSVLVTVAFPKLVQFCICEVVIDGST